MYLTHSNANQFITFMNCVFSGFFGCYSVFHCSNKPTIKIIDWSFLCQWANVKNQQGINIFFPLYIFLRFTIIIRNQKKTGTSDIKQSLCEKVCSVFLCYPNTAGSAKNTSFHTSDSQAVKSEKSHSACLKASSRSWFEHYFTQSININSANYNL